MYWFLEYITLQTTPKFEYKHYKNYVCMQTTAFKFL